MDLKEEVVIGTILSNFETKPFQQVNDDGVIASTLRSAIVGEEITTFKALAEIIGFTLFEESEYGQKNWGTYYGPPLIFPDADTIKETIPISRITSEMLDYWKQRADEATNPMLKSRYLGLFFEFCPIVKKTKPDFKEIIQPYLISLLESVEGKSYLTIHTIVRKLKRIISISASYNQKDIHERGIQCLIKFSRDDYHHTIMWKYEYDFLLGFKLPVEILRGIIENLHKRFLFFSRPKVDGRIDIVALEEVTKRLLDYYSKKKKDSSKILQILQNIEQCYEIMISDSNVFQAIHYLEHLEGYYKDHNFKEESDRIAVRIQELSKQTIDEYKVFREEYSYSKGEVEILIDSFLTGETEAIIDRIVDIFTPSIEDLKVRSNSEDISILDLLSKGIHDSNGRTLAKIGSVQDDEEGNVIKQMADDLSRASLILNWTLEIAINRGILTDDSINEIANNSSLITKEKIAIIKIAITSYFSKEYIKFIHLITPQIEAMCLNILHLNKGNVWRDGRSGGKYLRVLNDILEEPIFINSVGADISIYLRTVLTEQKGWNVRNNVAHGISKTEDFNFKIADRLLIIFILISSKLGVQNK